MKKMIHFILILSIIGIMYHYRTPIFHFVYRHFIMDKEIVIQDSNEYIKYETFYYVQDTNDFVPKQKQDLMNILYTIINRGWKEFTFYCDDNYTSCKDDITKMASDQELLSDINNFAHPFNSYQSISVGVDYFGKITIKVSPVYTEEEIKKINQKVDELYPKLVLANLSKEQNIKRIHNYIINRVRYDEQKTVYKDDKGNINYTNKSNTAYGPLFNGKALCGGYTDLMAIFLTKMGIPNFKVSSEKHIWNAVYINGKWKHLDLTWDDPIVNTGEDMLNYDFFLIDTNQLHKLDQKQHNFNQRVYQELH